MIKRIAVISFHASPIAPPCGTGLRARDVYVGRIAADLSSMGYEVDVFTRRDSECLPDVSAWRNDARVIHVPAGPPEFVPGEDLLPYAEEFIRYTVNFCKNCGTYDITHAHFFISGLIAASIKRILGTPFVMTFHGPGRERGARPAGSPHRIEIEGDVISKADAIIADSPHERENLVSLYDADPSRISVIPRGARRTWKTASRSVATLYEQVITAAKLPSQMKPGGH